MQCKVTVIRNDRIENPDGGFMWVPHGWRRDICFVPNNNDFRIEFTESIPSIKDLSSQIEMNKLKDQVRLNIKGRFGEDVEQCENHLCFDDEIWLLFVSGSPKALSRYDVYITQA